MAVYTEVAGRIRQLPPGVINKIAAGEVIERPASAVKELLENALDALATRIEVDIEAGGAELIRVTDDGEGIHPDDVELAVRSHATSKLRDADDLFHVRTMGFRGEALASIAEVSRFRLRSRQADQLTGVEVDVDGGILKEPRACGCPVGTRVEVRELFLNTPVRRKFLKGASTEFGHIAEQFTRIALARPNLQLVLRHNGKSVYDLAATGQLRDRLQLFYGGELADRLIPIEAEDRGSRLWGFVAHPAVSKATRKGQYLFLNGRWIQDRSLQHALGEAYRGLLMTGRYPIAFLFLELAPDEVDVNVHPTKCEVRLQDGQRLYRLILSTLRTKFLGIDIAASHRLQPPGSQVSPFGTPKPIVSPEQQERVQQEFVTWARDQFAAWKPNTDLSDLEARMDDIEREAALRDTRPLALANDVAAGFEAAGMWDDPLVGDAERSEPSFGPAGDSGVPRDVSTSSQTSTASPAPSATGSTWSSGRRAMQVHDCYLVLETGDGLTVIDQHALHERILYEHLRARVLAGSVEVQRLLIPIPVELTPREAALLLDQRELLAEVGLTVEEFSGGTVTVTSYPTLASRADPVELVRAAIERIETDEGKLSRRDLLDSLLHMMACKGAIKAGQRLSPEEIESLLEQRHSVDDSHHCPHGRPTSLTLSRMELDRQFGRLG